MEFEDRAVSFDIIAIAKYSYPTQRSAMNNPRK